jgi:hypothetical protein
MQVQQDGPLVMPRLQLPATVGVMKTPCSQRAALLAMLLLLFIS